MNLLRGGAASNSSSSSCSCQPSTSSERLGPRHLASSSPRPVSSTSHVRQAPPSRTTPPAASPSSSASWRPRGPSALSPQRHRQRTATRASVAAEAERTTEADDAAAADKVIVMDSSPNLYEEGAPQLPKPCEYQQTLITSFTVGGVGLNTGEYAYVRVRPAFAGEGRYFVRVPPGTNAASFYLQELPARSFEEMGHDGTDGDREVEGLKLKLFQKYLEAKEEQGFDGTFLKYLDYLDVRDKVRIMEEMGAKALQEDWSFEDPEPIQARGPGEKVWAAAIDSVYELEEGGVPGPECRQLVDQEGEVLLGVELLLSALEACGVDNARIEIEGGRELPIVDGSALGWTLDLQFTGLRYAPSAPEPQDLDPDAPPPPQPQALDPSAQGEEEEEEEGEEEARAPPRPPSSSPEELQPSLRLILRPKAPFVVRDEDSFIQFIPEDSVRLTVGIDHSEAAMVIGKQWKSWCMYEDQHYRFELAGARQYMESPKEVVARGALGQLKAGTEGVVIVAHQDSWWDMSLVRYIRDEPARHAMVDLIGDLSLNALPGAGGLPLGHIIAYKPHHALNAAFVRALQQHTTQGDWMPLLDLEDEEGGPDVEQEEEGEEGQGEEQ